MMNETGAITVITGPMWSGKSEELLRLIQQFEVLGYPSRPFSPNKGSKRGFIRGRAGNQITATVIKTADEALVDLPDCSSVYAFDEAHWLENLTTTAEKLARYGHQVLVGCLDLQWDGTPYPESANIFCVTDTIIKLRAVCVRCKKDAIRTAKLGERDGKIQWAPMCRRHWYEIIDRC